MQITLRCLSICLTDISDIFTLQAEAEEALAAALPALEEARIVLSDLENSDIRN